MSRPSVYKDLYSWSGLSDKKVVAFGTERSVASRLDHPIFWAPFSYHLVNIQDLSWNGNWLQHSEATLRYAYPKEYIQ